MQRIDPAAAQIYAGSLTERAVIRQPEMDLRPMPDKVAPDDQVALVFMDNFVKAELVAMKSRLSAIESEGSIGSTSIRSSSVSARVMHPRPY